MKRATTITTTTCSSEDKDGKGNDDGGLLLAREQKPQCKKIRLPAVTNRCRLMKCLSALFPLASVQPAIIPEPAAQLSRIDGGAGEESGMATRTAAAGHSGGDDGGGWRDEAVTGVSRQVE